MSINHAAVDRLIDSMSFTQKVGQLNQRLFGWKSVERNAAGRLVASDELKQEIDRWGGLGALYGLLRADPWSGQHWGNGIRPEERPEAVAVVQQTVLERGAHGIGVLLSEEAPHGHQALGGAVLPTNLGLGATFDSQGVQEAESRSRRGTGSQRYSYCIGIRFGHRPRPALGPLRGMLRRGPADGLPHVRGHRYRYAG